MSTDTTTIGELALRYASDLAAHLAMVPDRCIAHGQHPQATDAATAPSTAPGRACPCAPSPREPPSTSYPPASAWSSTSPVGDSEPATIAADLTHRLG
jgi:hypothetical protein